MGMGDGKLLFQPAAPLPDVRVNQSIQRVQTFRIVKRHGREATPVEGAVGIEDFGAKLAHDAGVGFAAGLLDLAAQLIGLDQKAPQIGKSVAYKTLAAGEASR